TTAMSKGYPIRSLSLSGIMIGALFNALLYVLIIFNQQKMNNIVNYMFGGFSSAEYNEVIYIGITLLIGIIILCSVISKIKILQLGYFKGISLGLNVQLLTYGLVLIALLIN